MGYILKNLNSGETYQCSDEFWINAINEATQNGWNPKGTRLSLEKEIDDVFDEAYGRMYNLFLVLSSHAKCIEWDGNYTDKEYQIVVQEDASNMMEELIYMGAEPDFLDFLAKGSFEIGPG